MVQKLLLESGFGVIMNKIEDLFEIGPKKGPKTPKNGKKREKHRFGPKAGKFFPKFGFFSRNF